MKSLRDEGYWAHAEMVEAHDYGSGWPKKSLYIVAVLNISADPDIVQQFFHKNLVSLRSPHVSASKDPSRMYDSLIVPWKQRRDVSGKCGIHSFMEVEVPRDNKKDKGDHKFYHRSVCVANGLP